MKTLTMAVVMLGLTVAATGCKKNPPKTQTPEAGTTVGSTETTAPGEEVRTGLPDPKGERVTLGTIYFEFDAATLTEEAKATLQKNASVLLENPGVVVRVEGHADERGSTQYNLALGEKRANAVKTYLGTLGVRASRLDLVSYGEEKPAETGHDEASWSKNRRVELAVTAGGDRVSSSY